jgi:hypothetical protein
MSVSAPFFTPSAQRQRSPLHSLLPGQLGLSGSDTQDNPSAAHVWHGRSHASAQQICPTQLLLAHSLGSLQTSPAPFRQLPETHCSMPVQPQSAPHVEQSSEASHVPFGQPTAQSFGHDAFVSPPLQQPSLHASGRVEQSGSQPQLVSLPVQQPSPQTSAEQSAGQSHFDSPGPQIASPHIGIEVPVVVTGPVVAGPSVVVVAPPDELPVAIVDVVDPEPAPPV